MLGNDGLVGVCNLLIGEMLRERSSKRGITAENVRFNQRRRQETSEETGNIFLRRVCWYHFYHTLGAEAGVMPGCGHGCRA